MFWALQGGGNSFCLVTRIDLRTLYAPKVMVGDATYGTEVKDQWLDSIYNFAINGDSDPKGAITPVARFGQGSTAVEYDSTLFYNGNNTRPDVLKDWLNGTLTPITSTFASRSMGEWGALERSAFEPGGAGYGFRQRFHVMPMRASREVIRIMHDTYFAGVEAQLADLNGFFTGLAFNPLPQSSFPRRMPGRDVRRV